MAHSQELEWRGAVPLQSDLIVGLLGCFNNPFTCQNVIPQLCHQIYGWRNPQRLSRLRSRLVCRADVKVSRAICWQYHADMKFRTWLDTCSQAMEVGRLMIPILQDKMQIENARKNYHIWPKIVKNGDFPWQNVSSPGRVSPEATLLVQESWPKRQPNHNLSLFSGADLCTILARFWNRRTNPGRCSHPEITQTGWNCDNKQRDGLERSSFCRPTTCTWKMWKFSGAWKSTMPRCLWTTTHSGYNHLQASLKRLKRVKNGYDLILSHCLIHRDQEQVSMWKCSNAIFLVPVLAAN